MPVRANFTMMYSDREYKLLGDLYKDKFAIGEYVEWRKIVRDRDYEANVSLHQGLITNLRSVDTGGRLVWYADVMENGGKTDLILLSKIRKIETN